ncbi:MAG TPA: hypothetical protein VH583_24705 [Vicinamibacterales bacterium]
MMIDSREAQVFHRPCAYGVGQLIASRINGNFAARNLLEQILELFV